MADLGILTHRGAHFLKKVNQMKPIVIPNPCTQCIYYEEAKDDYHMASCGKSLNAWGQKITITRLRKQFEDCEDFEQKRNNESLN